MIKDPFLLSKTFIKDAPQDPSIKTLHRNLQALPNDKGRKWGSRGRHAFLLLSFPSTIGPQLQGQERTLKIHFAGLSKTALMGLPWWSSG